MNSNLQAQLAQAQFLQQLADTLTQQLEQKPSLSDQQTLEIITLLMDLLGQVRQLKQAVVEIDA